MKNNAIARIILWCLTLTILVSMLAIGVLRTSPLSNGHLLRLRGRSLDEPSSAGVTGSAYQAEKSASVRTIQIDWLSGEIDIRTGDVDTVTVTETAPSNSEYAMYCRQSGDKLEISACRDTFISVKGINGSLKKDLTVLLPRNLSLKTLVIDSASSDITVTDMEIAGADINTTSGVSRFVNCVLGELELDTASGDLSYEGILDNLEVDAASAKVTVIARNVPDAIDVDTASGDLELTLPEDAGFTVKVDALSSKINSEFPCESRNGLQICGNGHCQIDMDTMSGKVNIYKSSSRSKLSLKK